jgi:Caudovirus prohead serine protease
MVASLDDLLAQLGDTVAQPATPAPPDDLLAQLMSAMAPTHPAQYAPPDLKSDYRTSAPFPTAYKADVNTKRGVITAYLTVYNDPSTGKPFVDSYGDVIIPGCFAKTIGALETARKAKGNPWLCPDLWQHDKRELIGGIKGLTEDSQGVIPTCLWACSGPEKR